MQWADNLEKGGPMAVVETVAAINTALTLIEKARKIYTELASKLSGEAEKAEANKNLREADESLQLAKAEIAKGFDFPLCKRHFPPGIRLSLGWRDGREHWQCSTCSDTWPPPTRDTEIKVDSDWNPLDY